MAVDVIVDLTDWHYNKVPKQQASKTPSICQNPGSVPGTCTIMGVTTCWSYTVIKKNNIKYQKLQSLIITQNVLFLLLLLLLLLPLLLLLLFTW